LAARTGAVPYMNWARHNQIGDRATDAAPYRSLREMRGDTERRREERQSTQQQ
jgi:hypothetical protein